MQARACRSYSWKEGIVLLALLCLYTAPAKRRISIKGCSYQRLLCHEQSGGCLLVVTIFFCMCPHRGRMKVHLADLINFSEKQVGISNVFHGDLVMKSVRMHRLKDLYIAMSRC